MSRLPLIIFIHLLAFTKGCLVKNDPFGTLVVSAPKSGHYEIYRVDSQEPLQFVSEQMGEFNQEATLSPGQYLILADCSHTTIIVRPGEKTELISHALEFVPPLEPSEKDRFSIQCTRYDQNKFRQLIANRFSLNVLSGTRDLLVGMVPLKVELEAERYPTPTVQTFDLAALRVADFDNMPPSTLFFLAPVGDTLSITEPQQFGNWQFLLPGNYLVEVNGTESEIELKALEQRTIKPAFLQVTAPKEIDTRLSVQIAGNPIYLELNGQHWLNLEETYPVLPGTLYIRISTSTKPIVIELAENETKVLAARALQVNYDCAPWEWLCLGSKAVYLFEKDGSSPIAVSMTDIPLLFFEENVLVSIEGSRDIKVEVKNDKVFSEYHTGTLNLEPQLQFRHGHITDLVRLESPGPPTVGHTIDLELEEASSIPLISGNYHLAQYTTLTTLEGDRRKAIRNLYIKPKETIHAQIPVYLTEKKWLNFKEKESSERTSTLKSKQRLSKLRPIIPLKIE